MTNHRPPFKTWLGHARVVGITLFFSTGAASLLLAVVFANCAIPGLLVDTTVGPVVGAVAASAERSRPPEPESKWNDLGIWYRVSDDPPTYLPKGYGRHQPRGDSDGTWVVDARDGKRLFVPKGGVGDLPEDTLLTDARLATNWRSQYPKPPKITRDTLIFGLD